jgi:hypothetical protein
MASSKPIRVMARLVTALTITIALVSSLPASASASTGPYGSTRCQPAVPSLTVKLLALRTSCTMARHLERWRTYHSFRGEGFSLAGRFWTYRIEHHMRWQGVHLTVASFINYGVGAVNGKHSPIVLWVLRGTWSD